MCAEIRISVKWKKIDYNLVSLSVSTKVKKKSIIMDKKDFIASKNNNIIIHF